MRIKFYSVLKLIADFFLISGLFLQVALGQIHTHCHSHKVICKVRGVCTSLDLGEVALFNISLLISISIISTLFTKVSFNFILCFISLLMQPGQIPYL